MMKSRTNIILALIIAIYIAVFSFISFARIDTHKSYLADIGIYDQVVWSTIHGSFMHQSYSFTGDSYIRFFYHFDPILLLFVPLYLIFATPKWFLLVQTIAVALSVIPIFWIARKRLGDSVALLISVCYLFYFPLQNGILYDFHEIGLAVPLVAFMLWAILEGRERIFWLLASLLLLVQEDMALLLFGIGFYLFASRKYRQGLLTMLISLTYFFIVMKLVIPGFSHSSEHLMFQATAGYAPRYAWLGSSLADVIRTIFTRPFFVINHVATPEVLKYFAGLFLPLALLPAGSLMIFAALPTIGINILSQNPMMYNYYFYHSVAIAPILFMSAVIVLGRIKTGNSTYFRPLVTGIAILSFIFIISCGVFPLSINPFRYTLADLRESASYNEIYAIKKLIPAAASVSTQENLGVFFSQRLFVYGFPVKSAQADYVVLCFNNPFYGVKRDTLFRYYMQRSEPERWTIVNDLITNHQYSVIYNHNGYLVLQKPRESPVL